MTDDPSFYCILGLHDQPLLIRYIGRYLREASEALTPGTVHGSGVTPEHAQARANTVRARVREELRCNMSN